MDDDTTSACIPGEPLSDEQATDDTLQSVKILGTKIHTVSLAESLRLICQALEQGKPFRVITANPEMIVLAEKDDKLARILEQADLVVPDGVGVVWAARFLGADMPERVAGIDLAKRVLEEAQVKNWRVFFLGGKPGVAEEAVRKTALELPGVELDSYHGYFGAAPDTVDMPEVQETQENQEKRETQETQDASGATVLAHIKNFNPHILLAGMGVPLQEYWLSQNPGLSVINMGVGGTFDVLSGRVKRAPEWAQRLRLEWLYRLIREPVRIKRQAVLFSFVGKVLKQRLEK
jgi:N-acetylglucosaminyldiphosphoundecaprenol N-acetyl-beta-D-mannosaminyltransferase